MTNRALLIASLANGRTRLTNALFSDDSRYFAGALQSLGFDVRLEETGHEMTITGLSGVIPSSKAELFIGNAGIWPVEGTAVSEMSDDRWRRTMADNVDGMFYTTRGALRLMGEGGRVVLVASTAGQRGEAMHADYAASKGAMIAFVKSVAVEVSARGITVNSAAPGWVDTEMCEVPFAGADGIASPPRFPWGGSPRSTTSPHPLSFSPDGTRIVYQEQDALGLWTLWLADSAGGNQRQLTTEGYEGPAQAPWSPDGSEILYVSTRIGTGDIFVYPVDGEPRQLIRDVRNDAGPAWSPDGRWVAFRSERGRQTDVGLVPAAGGTEIRLTDDPAEEGDIQWVPGTSTVAFTTGTTATACGPGRLPMAPSAGSRRTAFASGATVYRETAPRSSIRYCAAVG